MTRTFAKCEATNYIGFHSIIYHIYNTSPQLKYLGSSVGFIMSLLSIPFFYYPNIEMLESILIDLDGTVE
jgi:hypothetical protein